MSQNGQGFLNGLRGHAPLMSVSAPKQMSGLEGMPDMGPMGNMLGGPIIQNIMHSIGMAPMGLHDQSAMDVLRSQRFERERQKLLSAAAKEDEANYRRLLRGSAHIAGVEYGLEQRRAARELVGFTSNAAPLLAQMAPEQLDAMNGLRGSAVVMADRFLSGGRYRADPVTGSLGMSTDSVLAMSQDIYRDLYGADDVSSMQGISAGNLGQMFQAMEEKGLIEGTSASIHERTANIAEHMSNFDPIMLKQIAENQGISASKLSNPRELLSGTDLDKLALDASVSDRLRQFDADKVKRSLQDYVGAIGAVKELFGDLGRADAPMRELFAGLESLTQGNLSQIDPGRLNMMVRTTRELSKATGLGIDAVMAVQNHAASYAESLGGERSMGVESAQQAVAYGHAWRSLGYNRNKLWAGYTPDQVTQKHAELTVAASLSQAANGAAVASRLSDAVGGFEEGSRAESFVSTLRSAKMTRATEYYNPDNPTANKMESLDVPVAELYDMLTNARNAEGTPVAITGNTVSQYLSHTKLNQEEGEDYSFGVVFRRNQRTSELLPDTEIAARDVLRSRFLDDGASEELANTMANELSAEVGQNIVNMSRADMDDTTRRNKTISGIMQKAVEGSSHAKEYNDLLTAANTDIKTSMGIAGSSFYGHASNQVLMNPGLGHQNYGNYHRMHDRAAEETADRMAVQIHVKALMSDAMSGITEGSTTSNVVQAIMDAEEGDKGVLSKLLSEAVGGVSEKEIVDRLSGPIHKMKSLSAEFDKIAKIYENATTPEQRSESGKALEAAQKEWKLQARKVVDLQEGLGLDNEETLTDSDFEKAEKAHKLFLKQAPTWEDGESAEFWKSDKGEMYREVVDDMLDKTDAISSKVIMSDSAIRKLGVNGILESNRISKDRQRIRELSAIYTDNDDARLVAQDFETADPDEKERVNAEVTKTLQRMATSKEVLRDYNSRKGRQWGSAYAMSQRLQSQGVSYTEKEIEAARGISELELADIKKYEEDEQEFRDDLERFGDYDKTVTELEAGSRARFQGLSEGEFKELQDRSIQLREDKASLSGDGMSPDERIKAAEVFDDLNKLATDARESIEIPSREYVDDYAKTFDVEFSDQEKTRLAAVIDGEGGAPMMQAILSGHKRIQHIADAALGKDPNSPNTNADTMLQDYTAAKEAWWRREHKEGKFREKYNLTEWEYEKLAPDLRREQKLGLDTTGSTSNATSKRTDDTGGHAVDVFQSAVTRGEIMTDDGVQLVRLANDSFKIAGQLNIDGNLSGNMSSTGKDDVRRTN